MTSETVLRDGTVLTPQGPVRSDVRVQAGTVVAVGSDLDGEGIDVDCTGAWVGPGSRLPSHADRSRKTGSGSRTKRS